MRNAFSAYQLVLFDVDHTLLDFELAEQRAIQKVWEGYFKNSCSLVSFSEAHHDVNTSLWKDVEQGKVNPSEVRVLRSERLLRRFEFDGVSAQKLGDEFLAELGKTAEWLPGAESFFQFIADKCKVGLITNGLCAVQYPRIDSLGIRAQLATYQISEEVGFSKPHPEMFKRALEETRVEAANCLMIGDSLSSDFQGAINAGIDFCWYNPAGTALPSAYPAPRFILNEFTKILEN